MYWYRAFMLRIGSNIPFPELPMCEPCDVSDVSISLANISIDGLENPILKYTYCHITESELWLHIPMVSYFLVRNGNQIIIDPVQPIDEDSIRLFVLGSCMGALLMQRGVFLLHGNAIKIADYCMAIVGESGAGKSTVAAGFVKRGYSILADDICAIHSNTSVLPSMPQLKLWHDAATQLEINIEGLRRIRPQHEKYAVPITALFHQHTLPLKIIYLLSSHDSNHFSLENIVGLRKLEHIHNNIYRKEYLIPARQSTFLKKAILLANQIVVVHIRRPKNMFQLEPLIDFILDDLQSKGISHVAC